MVEGGERLSRDACLIQAVISGGQDRTLRAKSQNIQARNPSAEGWGA